ncbi:MULTISPECIES: hypothetical protein [unclassified Solibacillus]|uniref:hypothetical protein n=1 Tax=unclassified Solibacillus TaxID=2637870 RepID=UPI0030F4F5CE
MKRILIGLSFMFMLVGCSNKNEENSPNSDKVEEVNASTQLLEDNTAQIDKLELQNEELQATLDNLQTDFSYKEEEAAYYKQLIADLIKDYSDAQLKDLAINLWDYELQINGVLVPVNGLVDIQDQSIEISLIERQTEYPILPSEIFMQGQISGDYIDHIKVNSNPSETYVTDGTVVTAVHHKYENVEKGSTISFTITEELKERLGLETTEITINKK